MAEGPQAGLDIIATLAASGDLDDYHLLHAARADLLRRNGSSEEAARSYQRAFAGDQ
jgi:RNA polymerase sigma-70 factor (ECF subfamily)